MQRNPRAHVLLVGSDEVAYGAKRGDGLSWRDWALKQWPMDPSRLHQLPALGYDDYKRDPTKLDTCVLDRTLHLELEFDGSHGQWLLHRCQ